MKATPTQATAMQKLRGNHDVLELLDARLAGYQDNLVKMADPAKLRILQGRAQEVQELLELVRGGLKAVPATGRR